MTKVWFYGSVHEKLRKNGGKKEEEKNQVGMFFLFTDHSKPVATKISVFSFDEIPNAAGPESLEDYFKKGALLGFKKINKKNLCLFIYLFT